MSVYVVTIAFPAQIRTSIFINTGLLERVYRSVNCTEPAKLAFLASASGSLALSQSVHLRHILHQLDINESPKAIDSDLSGISMHFVSGLEVYEQQSAILSGSWLRMTLPSSMCSWKLRLG